VPLTSFLPSNLPAVAHFIARLNRFPAHYICYPGLTESEIAAELAVTLTPEGFGCLALDDSGEIAGFLGVEMDPSLGRAWLFGPFVDQPDWHPLADQLYQVVLDSLPPAIHDLELCGSPENTRLEAFAARHGFTPNPAFSQLSLPRPAAPPPPPDPTPLATPAGIVPHLPALAALHDTLFPNTYYRADQLLDLSAKSHKRLQVELLGGELAGYIFVQVRPASQDAYIDFLGVAEACRRRGIARRLLDDSLAWAFSHPFVAQASLTVQASNLPAVRLYENLGFKTDLILQGYRNKTIN
jgi:hypothetical protein